MSKQLEKAKFRLREIAAYYARNRNVKHSQCVLCAYFWMKETTSGLNRPLVLCATLNSALNFGIHDNDAVSLRSIVRLRGRNRPLLVDNYALEMLCVETLSAIEQLEADCGEAARLDELKKFEVAASEKIKILEKRNKRAAERIRELVVELEKAHTKIAELEGSE